MLPKNQRLTKAAFDAHFKTGKRYHSPHLQLIHAGGVDLHAAAVVGKKVFKQAVKRNQVRRQLYGVLYRAHQAGALTGTNILIAKPGVKTLSRQALLAEAKALIERSN